MASSLSLVRARVSSLLPLLLLMRVPVAQGYNVDVQNVAVYRGPEDTMFGFSVSGYTDRDSSW